MKLHAVKAAALIGHRGIRRIGRARDRTETGRQRLDAIPVAHPDIEQHAPVALAIAQPIEQRTRRAQGDLGVAELACVAARDAAAELLRHRLHAVANAEHRHRECEYRARCPWRRSVSDRLRTAREDDAACAEGTHRGFADIPGMDLAVDAELAHAARDQLSILRAEIQYQNPVRVNIRIGCYPIARRNGNELRRRDNSATPW